ncbi:hypothetical protein [Streptomyces sp. NPDC086519]
MSPPPAQRPTAERVGATVVEAPGGHAGRVARPEAVVGVIDGATAAG